MLHRCWNKLSVHGESKDLDLFVKTVEKYEENPLKSPEHINIKFDRIILIPKNCDDLEKWKLEHWGCNGKIESPSIMRYKGRLDIRLITDTKPMDKLVESIASSTLYMEYDFTFWSYCPDTLETTKIKSENGEILSLDRSNANTKIGKESAEQCGFIVMNLIV